MEKKSPEGVKGAEPTIKSGRDGLVRHLTPPINPYYGERNYEGMRRWRFCARFSVGKRRSKLDNSGCYNKFMNYHKNNATKS